jgi:hypothetical protein
VGSEVSWGACYEDFLFIDGGMREDWIGLDLDIKGLRSTSYLLEETRDEYIEEHTYNANSLSVFSASPSYPCSSPLERCRSHSGGRFREQDRAEPEPGSATLRTMSESLRGKVSRTGSRRT